jgi:hypothetical protein
MKKTILLVISLLFINLFTINLSHADALKNKLYKATILSTNQIKKDYPKKIHQKIVQIFTKYRYEKDINTLNKLKNLLKSRIQSLNSKSFLNSKEKKLLNFYNNLYYRTELLLRYNFK